MVPKSSTDLLLSRTIYRATIELLSWFASNLFAAVNLGGQYGRQIWCLLSLSKAWRVLLSNTLSASPCNSGVCEPDDCCMTVGLSEFFVKNSTFSNFILIIVVSFSGREALLLSVGIFHFDQFKFLIKYKFRDRCLFWGLRIAVLRHTYLPSKTCRKLALCSI